MSELYKLSRPVAPWRDYGDILLHGMVSWRSEGEPLALERTGPFIPALTMPWFCVVVRDDLKSRLHAALLERVVFRPVVKKRIVRLEWNSWNRHAPEPLRYPAGGEPENYVLGRKHNTEVAEALGPLWELVIPVVPGLQGEGGRVVRSKYQEQLICRAGRDGGFIFVASELRDQLVAEARDCVKFEPAPWAESK